MDIVPSLVTTYGPLALGWLVAAYLLKFILERYDNDINSRITLAVAINELTRELREKR